MDLKEQKLKIQKIINNDYSCTNIGLTAEDCASCLIRSEEECANIEFKKHMCDTFMKLVKNGCIGYMTNIQIEEWKNDTINSYKEKGITNPKLSIQNPLRHNCDSLYELQPCTSSINTDTNKGSDVYKLVDNSVEKCITNYPRLLGLMQYGLFITQMDGHLYIDVNYECVTSESEELQDKIKDKGITFISKIYEGYEEALDRVDNLLEAFGMKKLGIVGNYLIESKRQEE